MTIHELSALPRRTSRYSADNSEWVTELSALPRRTSRYSADNSEGVGR